MYLFYPFNPILYICVELAEAVYLLGGSIPVASPIRLEEGGHELAEAVGIGRHEPCRHLRVVYERAVGLIIDPVVHLLQSQQMGCQPSDSKESDSSGDKVLPQPTCQKDMVRMNRQGLMDSLQSRPCQYHRG